MTTLTYDRTEALNLSDRPGQVVYWKIIRDGKQVGQWMSESVEDMLELAPVMRWNVDESTLPKESVP